MEEIQKEPYESNSSIGKRIKSENTKNIDEEIFKLCGVKTLYEINDLANTIKSLISREDANTSKKI